MNQWLKLRNSCTGSKSGGFGPGCSARPSEGWVGRSTPKPDSLTGGEATLKVCGVGVGDAAGVELGAFLVKRSCGERGESAGINRHEERDENARHRRSSDPRWPRVMRWRPVRAQRSVDRGTCRPAMEPRNHCFGVPTSSHEAEGHTAGGVSASRSVDPARSENLRMHGVLMRENREIPCSPVRLISGRAAQGTLRR